MTGQLHESIAKKVNGEAAVVLGWGRAILMQVAHPLVAAGVVEHSGFGGGPREYFRRSYRTIAAMLELTFGSPEVVQARADAINRIHHRVHGQLLSGTALFPTGTDYSATNPELLQWVHATLVDSQLISYQMFVGDLSPVERNRYCAEASEIGPQLGVPRGQLPETERELTTYLERMRASGAIEVTDSARRLGEMLLRPRGLVLRSALRPARLLTIGLLPEEMRAAYGFAWGAADARRLRWLVKVVRGGQRLAPPRLSRWPIARRSSR